MNARPPTLNVSASNVSLSSFLRFLLSLFSFLWTASSGGARMAARWRRAASFDRIRFDCRAASIRSDQIRSDEQCTVELNRIEWNGIRHHYSSIKLFMRVYCTGKLSIITDVRSYVMSCSISPNRITLQRVNRIASPRSLFSSSSISLVGRVQCSAVQRSAAEENCCCFSSAHSDRIGSDRYGCSLRSSLHSTRHRTRSVRQRATGSTVSRSVESHRIESRRVEKRREE